MRKNPANPASSESVPVSVRAVVLDIQDDGSMHVIVDGAPLPPDQGAWTRTMFPQIIDQASQDRTIPVRVEVHEADGATFTDLIPAAPRRTREPEAKPKKPKPAPPRRLIEVTGDGFVAGEDVACCLIVAHTDAAPDGTARAVFDPKQVTAVGEAILIGRISGTLVARSLS